MSQVNNFNGGLNTRILPHLISLEESTICTNIDTYSEGLKSLKDDLYVENADTYIYNFKDLWLYNSTYRDYLVFQEKLYYSDGISIPQKSTDGINFSNLGIKLPDAAPTVTKVSGTLNDTYQYMYTYYNSIDGTESQPSIYSEALTYVDENASVTVLPSTDSQVDTIRIYRLGGALITPGLVVELSNVTQTYIDSKQDVDITDIILDSFNNGQAPIGLEHLTEHNVMLFGSVGSTLYFSEVAFTNYWSAFNFIEFDDTITGIGSLQNGLVVMTRYKTYIVVGTSPDTLAKYLLTGNQGCLSNRSVQFSNNSLLWASSDGICATSGGVVEVISRPKLGKLDLSSLQNSVVFDDVYYLSLDTYTLCLDYRASGVFRQLDIFPSSWHVYNDMLYYSSIDKLYVYEGSNVYKEFHYKSGRLGEGQITNLKNYKNIYLYIEGLCTCICYIDGVEVGRGKDLITGGHEIKFNQAMKQGYYLEVEIFCIGSVLEYQFVAEGRRNGR